MEFNQVFWWVIEADLTFDKRNERREMPKRRIFFVSLEMKTRKHVLYTILNYKKGFVKDGPIDGQHLKTLMTRMLDLLLCSTLE